MKYILAENNFQGSNIMFVYIISIISIFLGIYVIISKNPILSVLFLIGLFSSVAVYLIVIGLHFIGLSYLLVYIGAVSILFLFILMLINVRISELVTDNKNSIPLAILILLLFNYSINDVIPYSVSIFDIMNNHIIYYIYSFFQNSVLYNTINSSSKSLLEYILLTNLGSVKTESWEGMLVHITHIASLGNILYTNLFILFIITSLILLLAMVGAIIITINKSLSTVKSVNFNNYIKN